MLQDLADALTLLIWKLECRLQALLGQDLQACNRVLGRLDYRGWLSCCCSRCCMRWLLLCFEIFVHSRSGLDWVIATRRPVLLLSAAHAERLSENRGLVSIIDDLIARLFLHNADRLTALEGAAHLVVSGRVVGGVDSSIPNAVLLLT